MKLYLIKQNINKGYDTYNAAIVAAPTDAAAKLIHPCISYKSPDEWDDGTDMWCTNPDDVIAEYLGEAAEGIEQGVVLASFNAG